MGTSENAKEKANNNENNKAIKHAEDHADVATLKGKKKKTVANTQLATETNNLEKEIAKHKDPLDKAKAIREKKLTELNAAEKDLREPIASLKIASTVLSRHPGGSLRQTRESKLISAATNL